MNKGVQAEYKKEWMDTYLWILPETQIQDSYIEKNKLVKIVKLEDNRLVVRRFWE